MYDLVSAPTTKFLGNSLEVYPYGGFITSIVEDSLWNVLTARESDNQEEI